MKTDTVTLLPNEQAALLDALRRDLRAEAQKVAEGGPDRGLHLLNVRMTKRLLEALNPKCRGDEEATPKQTSADAQRTKPLAR